MLIGIVGKIGSGKTTLAEYIKTNYNFDEYILSSPIKKIGEIFGFDKANLYGTQEQKLEIHPYWKVSARTFLQKIGTDLFRDRLKEVLPEMCHSNSVWIDMFRKKYLENKKTNMIVSDVRFVDEAEAIKELGGILIRIERTYSGKESSEQVHHKSEEEMDKIKVDFNIINDGSKSELYSKIDRIMILNSDL
jgi:dephospho-CoA kinase